MKAYACRIARENLPAIASEKPDFDLAETLAWLDEHETGYFLRDASSPFDCAYLDSVVFLEMYVFDVKDDDELFRRVWKI